MKYDTKLINGDSGEYFVAYKMTRLLGWPCRLYGVDLGVDAELEILNNDKTSTGNIIKLQIKSTESSPSDRDVSIYLDDRHIQYWKRFCIPVIICAVDLIKEEVYWKQVKDTEAYASGGESRLIKFSRVSDKFHKGSLVDFSKLAIPDASKNIEPLFKMLSLIRKELPSYIPIPTYDEVNRIEDLINNAANIISQIRGLSAHFPWRLSLLDLQALDSAEDQLKFMRTECWNATSDLAGGG